MKTIAVIPAYNEEGKIGITVRKTKPYVDRVVVVDDGSLDKTYDEAKGEGATVFKHKRNMGVGAALRTGFEFALRENYEVCVQLGGDDQFFPSQIPQFLKKIKEGKDFVMGSRHLRKEDSENMPLFRKLTTKSFSLFFSLVARKRIKDASNGFIAFRTEILKNIDISPQWLNRYELEPYMLLKVIERGYKIAQIPSIQNYDKIRGYSKMDPFGWWHITKPLFKGLPRALLLKR